MTTFQIDHQMILVGEIVLFVIFFLTCNFQDLFNDIPVHLSFAECVGILMIMDCVINARIPVSGYMNGSVRSLKYHR